MRAPAPRLVWLGAAAILVVAALVALAAIVRGDFSETDGRILGSLAAVLYTGGALFAGLATVERGRPVIGWAVSAVAPMCFALLLLGIWDFEFDGGDQHAWRWAWSAVLVLLVGIMVTTALLLARSKAAQLLADAAGVAAGIAAALSITAIWAQGGDDNWIKPIAVFSVLAVLAYVLVPVAGRLTRADRGAGSERVLAELGNVELIATAAPGAAGIDLELARGERLVLRYRSGTAPSLPSRSG